MERTQIAPLLTMTALLTAGLLVAQGKDPSQVDQRDHPPLTEGQGQGFCVQPNIPIPDLGQADSTQTIIDSFNLVDLDVSVTLNHTFISDLEIQVEHGGTIVTLYDNHCGSEDDMDILFDDEAAIVIGNNCASPYVGTFQPFESLTAFDGVDAQGDWTLTVFDQVGADIGTLLEWCLVTDPVAVDLMEFEID